LSAERLIARHSDLSRLKTDPGMLPQCVPLKPQDRPAG
jgi:hypothetical protein